MTALGPAVLPPKPLLLPPVCIDCQGGIGDLPAVHVECARARPCCHDGEDLRDARLAAEQGVEHAKDLAYDLRRASPSLDERLIERLHDLEDLFGGIVELL